MIRIMAELSSLNIKITLRPHRISKRSRPGAAERVMSVLELKPDIDPDHGVDAGLAVSRWDLAFEGVKFYYQMRPRTMVLDEEPSL